MIVASILLILVAVVLLVAGLAGGSSPLLITSIAASLLAAVALVAGARQAASTRNAADRGDRPRDRTAPGDPPYGVPPGEPEIPVQHIPTTDGAGVPGWRQPPGSPAADPLSPAAFPDGVDPRADAPAPTSPAADGPFDGDPPAQPLSAAELARLAGLDDEVRVVDGHPRFHLPDCPHLVGRADEPLPVAEAVDLGFTPCAGCAPATALLADPPLGRSW
ncbi:MULTISPECIES: hypothetical protein [Micromonospora]|uniref:Uncharacterized protein n=1 Tax=Micromonospora solifontis TaxID=2487138 RepID=A0ABX9WG14_9ACTN|nr:MULTISPECIES: hypothetical protein [Micromonospora]NES12249.1 hypothetical protein [Micromonospora sp. PPF5-17B]NES36948.1 hypothetical protein [Micromonospora solifontis]NES54268.1 hypothetical protein [Micromonospora sp. PPF5-6]RNL98870.1 hypothetical protein EFE23_12380 [Micromonospora solifontis]